MIRIGSVERKKANMFTDTWSTNGRAFRCCICLRCPTCHTSSAQYCHPLRSKHVCQLRRRLSGSWSPPTDPPACLSEMGYQHPTSFLSLHPFIPGRVVTISPRNSLSSPLERFPEHHTAPALLDEMITLVLSRGQRWRRKGVFKRER